MNPFVKRRLLAPLAVLLAAAPAAAYEVLLDIDTDNDPTTINEITDDTTTMVRMILAPSYPGEEVSHVEFGLGGSCRECEGVFGYGVSHDVVDWADDDWLHAQCCTSSWDYCTCSECPGDVGFHLLLRIDMPAPLTLDGPAFIRTFQAWVQDPPQDCPQVPSNLACFHDGEFWNYVQIGGSAVANGPADWGAVKALYR